MPSGEMIWDQPVWKGTAADFSEDMETLRSPCFVATAREEALHYAQTLPTEDAGLRRVLELLPVRPLRLLLLDRADGGRRMLADLGIAWSSPGKVAEDLRTKGYDGVALDGGDSGIHLVLNDGGLVRHVETHALDMPAPAP